MVALRALLKLEGLGLDDYKMLEVGGVKERLDALLAGQGDATLLGPPFDATAIAAGQRRLGTVQERYPRFPGQGLVVSRQALPRLRDTLREWLQALETACQHAVSAPDDVTAALQSAGGLDAATAQGLQRAIPTTLRPDREGVELLIAMRRDLGFPGSEDTFEQLVQSSL